ncbi:hypothetical protein A1D31_11755 [Bradyrhizobium liaoningense]|nr:hypothetical protein A1D31_11755 [Bradyrhizobium liaoningense]
MRHHQEKYVLPRYVTRARLNGGAYGYSFQVYPGGPHTRLHGKPGWPEFRAEYSAALVDAAAAEQDERIPMRERAAYAAEIAAVCTVAVETNERISKRSRGR